MTSAARPSVRARLERWLVDGWSRKGLVHSLFFLPSLLTCAIARQRHRRHLASGTRGVELRTPIVVVGNLIAGGAGKTPIVIALVEALRARGLTPGVIARGYGATAPTGEHAAPVPVQADSDPSAVGDEPLLVASRTRAPVMVHRKRALAAHALLAARPDVDVIVSDDGLQHYALDRSVEIVVFDARGAGNGACLPAGPLREPLDRARDATVFANCPIAPELTGAGPAFSVPIETTGLHALDGTPDRDATAQLQGARVSAYAGIAHPDKFFDSLRALGAVAVDEHPLPDHASFGADAFADAACERIVITEKDAVKCARIPGLAGDPRLRVLRIDARLPPPLVDLIKEKLDGPKTA